MTIAADGCRWKGKPGKVVNQECATESPLGRPTQNLLDHIFYPDDLV